MLRSVPTIGVLAAWHVYEGTTLDDYLSVLLEGVSAAARDHACNLLLACGVAPPPPPRVMTPAWPLPMPDAQFVPVGPWNADGLIIVPDTLSAERVSYVQSLIADGYPVVFAGASDLHPSVAVDNAGGTQQALQHLIAHGHQHIAFISNAPPAWLIAQYPDILPIDHAGRRVQFGNRCHYCVTSPDLAMAARRIAEAMGRHCGNNPNVIGWQIDIGMCPTAITTIPHRARPMI